MKPPRPSLDERLRQMLQSPPAAPRDVTAGPSGTGPGAGSLSGLWRGMRSNVLGDMALGMTPVGIAADVEDLAKATKQRNPLAMALAGVGMVPVAGDVVKGLAKGGRAAARKAAPTMQAATELPMDTPSRMARAEAMGYTTPVYHGTSRSAPFDEFLPRSTMTKLPHRFDADAIHVGTLEQAHDRLGDVFGLTKKPYESAAAPESWTPERMEYAKNMAPEDAHPSVMPLVMKNEQPYLNRGMPFTENELLQRMDAWKDEAFGTEHISPQDLQRAFKQHLLDQGFDTVPYINRFEGPGQISYMVLKPEHLRSRFARFDPAQAGSTSLMAGLGGLFAASAGARAVGTRNEEPNDR